MDVECEDQKIENISGVNSTKPEAVDEIASADLVTTAVGLVILPRIAPTIAAAIEKRMADGNKEPMNIIACENAIRGTSQLKKAVYENLSEEGKAFADEYVGFPDCAVDRIVPPVKSENFIYVVVEELIPESQTNKRKELMALFTLIGFSIMMILDVALG